MMRRVASVISTFMGLGVLQACTSNYTARPMTQYSELIATPVTPADHKIAYGSEPLQFGELRLPAGSEPAPLVVLIHGGCWRAQYDLKHVGAAAAALTKEGFAV